MAPTVYTLWQNVLRFDPADPTWFNRDRFVLSAGHASMVLYSILHLTQTKAVSDDYKVQGTLAVPLDDIKKFRQLDSKCPGIPNTAGPAEWKRRRVRWVRAWQTASGWRSPDAGWPPTTTSRASTDRLQRLRAVW
jgi:hypothetical protein